MPAICTVQLVADRAAGRFEVGVGRDDRDRVGTDRVERRAERT